MEYRVSLEESKEEGQFFIELEGKKAVLDFVKKGNEVYVTHTYTPPEFRGRGIAAKLMEALIDYCKKNNMRIYPICSYAVSFFEKNAELKNMLSENYLKERE
ncbi:MAG: GNAT family N-acetyltransferase [Thermoproteota archaeon]|jgi:predicted GNAT family acetyltransferase